ACSRLSGRASGSSSTSVSTAGQPPRWRGCTAVANGRCSACWRASARTCVVPSATEPGAKPLVGRNHDARASFRHCIHAELQTPAHAVWVLWIGKRVRRERATEQLHGWKLRKRREQIRSGPNASQTELPRPCATVLRVRPVRRPVFRG